MSVRGMIFVLTLVMAAGCHQGHPEFTAQQKGQIQDLVKTEIAKGSFPGAVVLIGQDQTLLFEEAYGNQIIEPNTLPMTVDTVFDLASLTKPLATAASVMVLMDQSRLDPNDTVATYLPDFACEGKDQVQIRHLLTHTSGLPAYTGAKALEDAHGSPCPDELIKTICEYKPLNEPGETFRYSCLGYILLSRIVAEVSGQELDQFSRTHLFEPMGMQHTTFNPPDAWHDRVAASEIVNDQVLCGTVHDPLARLMGGVSGNAGLFSTASDIALLCRMLLNGGKLNGSTILSEQVVTLMTTPQVKNRAFGFDVDSSYAWIKGDHASAATFCHSGYTGTSVVCDPQTRRFVIILTNRAHPHDKGTVKPVRTGIADIVFRDLTL
ncbi:MAG: beta-lactamase family protein [Planctomycetes bacterium]|nr:beta-lactamase family protein [Planctomycetota bacterium]